MDALKAEISIKRKAIQEDPVLNGRPTKYMRRGELERLKEEQERKAREEKQKELKAKQDSEQSKVNSYLTISSLLFMKLIFNSRTGQHSLSCCY